jgi:hypothetical protein
MGKDPGTDIDYFKLFNDLFLEPVLRSIQLTHKYPFIGCYDQPAANHSTPKELSILLLFLGSCKLSMLQK